MECGDGSTQEEVTWFRRVPNTLARDVIHLACRGSNGCLFSAGLSKTTNDETKESYIGKSNNCYSIRVHIRWYFPKNPSCTETVNGNAAQTLASSANHTWEEVSCFDRVPNIVARDAIILE